MASYSEYFFRLAKQASTNSLIAISLMLFHVGLLAVLAWGNFPWLTGDSPRYIRLAYSILSGHGFGVWNVNGFEPEIMRSVGYPAIVAAGLFLTGPSLVGVIILHCGFYVLSVFFVWRVGTEVLGNGVGKIFLIVLAVYPFVAYSIFQISPEIPSLFTISFACYLLLDVKPWRLIFATVLLCLAAQLRPNLVLLFCVIVVGVVLQVTQVLKRLSYILAAAVLTLMTFAIYNHAATGNFTPLPAAGGLGHSLMLTSWMAKVPIDSLITYGMTGKVDSAVAESGMVEQITEINKKAGVPEDTIFVTVESYPDNQTRVVVNRLLMEGAIQNIKGDIPGYLTVVASNALRMWFSTHLPRWIPWPIRIGLVFQGIAIFVLALIGIGVFLWRHNWRDSLAALFMIGSFGYCVVTLSFLHTEARYTIPFRLFLLLFAAYGLVAIHRNVWARFRPS